MIANNFIRNLIYFQLEKILPFKMHIEKFNQFDYSKKGYLTNYEYQAFCYSLLLKPQQIDSNKITFKMIEQKHNFFKKNDINDLDYKPYFNFLSNNSNNITSKSLKQALQKLSIANLDVEEMINYFNEEGQITFEQFMKIFE